MGMKKRMMNDHLREIAQTDISQQGEEHRDADSLHGGQAFWRRRGAFLADAPEKRVVDRWALERAPDLQADGHQGWFPQATTSGLPKTGKIPCVSEVIAPLVVSIASR